MVKAGRKSINREVAKANDAQTRKLQAELDERLKQFEQRAAETAKARKALTRALEVEAGRVAPPWASKLLQLMPTALPASTLDGFVPSKKWLTDEVGRMKVAGEIPAAVTKVDFSEELARRMQKAAETDRSVRPIQPGSIANQLPRLGLWPIK